MVYEGDIDIAIVPGSEGEMGILPNHAPLLSTLKMGIIRLRIQEEEKDFTVSGGIIEVQPDLITIMADAAENVAEIDVARAEEAKRRAEEMLAKGVDVGSDVYLKLESALRRSNLRLDAAKRYRGQRFPGGGAQQK
jgi:F-type H+-transporting ATPase subunit epsilon